MYLSLQTNAEPIPGYVLLERLGSGGYGEVWKASAPGGLTKAVKLVYGRLSDARAARELKALSRIREVRHPFLLSLERFDVVDGQLVIVTELAEASLADRFRTCREQHLLGIPRQELLQYLSDAAEALDYMSERFGLQHLDIKPENLLLVGGRVKVADFGLVKDLQETQLTCVGGVTPLYATPETFAGKASRHSDQYSLAIVYQEMLTGTFPFPGQTTAQLANQHLYEEPLLAPLPPSDRPIVARALAKRPEDRWSNCRQFVAMLSGCGLAAEIPLDVPRHCPHSAQTPPPQYPQAGAALQARPSPTGAEVHVGASRSNRNTPPGHAEPTRTESPCLSRSGGVPPSSGVTAAVPSSLPPLDLAALDRLAGPKLAELALEPQPLSAHPAIIVGLGGTGGVVLRKLRAMLVRQYESPQNLPAWRWLWLETDARSFSWLSQTSETERLTAEETMLLPLRRTTDYRSTAPQLLSWLSRRWLYNIPRSQRTEGLRPLGRLAWHDQQAQAAARIGQLVQAALVPEALERTRRTLGAAKSVCQPRAYVVASLCGGTAGMLADVAVTIRTTLTEAGHANASLHLLLAFFTSQQSAANDLRRTNAYAALTELNHLAVTAPNGRAPWDSVYLVDLGRHASEAEYEVQAARLAEYLALELTTPCGAILQQCREAAAAPQEQTRALHVRTFAVHTLPCGKYEAADQQALSLACQVAKTWREHENKSAITVQSPTLEPGELLVTLSQTAEGVLGGPLPGCMAQAAAEGGSPAAVRERLYGILGPLPGQRPLGTLLAGQEVACQTKLEAALVAEARRMAADASHAIANCVLGHVNGNRVRLGTALRSLDAWNTLVREARQPIEAELASYESIYGPDHQGARNTPAPGRSGSAGRARRNLDVIRPLDFCKLLVRARLVEAAAVVYWDLTGHLIALGERLARLRVSLDQVERLLAERDSGDSTETACGAALARLAADPDLVAALEAEFAATVLSPQGGLLELVKNPSGPQEMADQLYRLARTVLRRKSEGLNIASVLLEQHPQPAALRAALEAELARVVAPLHMPADRSRLLVLLPEGPAADELEALLRELAPPETIVVRGGIGDVVFCLEAGPRHAVPVASALADYRPDIAAAARRVLSRCDVAWSELPLAARPEQASPCVGAQAEPGPPA